MIKLAKSLLGGMIGVCTVLVSSLVCTVCAEYIPPPTTDELLGADVIACGRFVTKNDGHIAFEADKVLKGDVRSARDLLTPPGLWNLQNKEGHLSVLSRGAVAGGASTSGLTRISAEKRGLWFFFSGRRASVDWQPVELAPGYRSLLKGEAPNIVFSLLQELDADKRRMAMEELIATPKKLGVAELHKIAENGSPSAAVSSVCVLNEMKLLDASRFWGKWALHPAKFRLMDKLKAVNNERLLQELVREIRKEKNPARLEILLYDIQKYPRAVHLDITLGYMDHPSAVVRRRVIGTLWDTFWRLGWERRKSAKVQKEFDELSARVVPLLRRQIKIEKVEHVKQSIERLLARKDELPLTEKLSSYSRTEELDFLLNRLTNHGHHGFVMESAGRELVTHHLDAALREMRKRLSEDKIYNADMVMDGLGYMRHDRCFAFIVQHSKEIDVGHRTFCSTLRALGRQNNKGSYNELLRVKREKIGKLGHDYKTQCFFSALGECRDPKAKAELLRLKSHADYRDRIAYVGALAKHGDKWVIGELLQFLKDARKCEVLKKDWCSRNDVAVALTHVDTKAATDALKQYITVTWPEKTPKHFPFGRWGSQQMENYAGPLRRSTPIGEVARRDPQWLAGLALARMGSESLVSRELGHEVFRQLTGKSFDFRPKNFAHERKAPLLQMEGWWRANKEKTREEWLLAHFRNKGFSMPRLWRVESLPVLCKALSADFFTHNLAVEQISVITQKYFRPFRLFQSSQGQEKMTIRVIGWLKAHGHLADGKQVVPSKRTIPEQGAEGDAANRAP
jgi:hypothetical protein